MPRRSKVCRVRDSANSTPRFRSGRDAENERKHHGLCVVRTCVAVGNSKCTMTKLSGRPLAMDIPVRFARGRRSRRAMRPGSAASKATNVSFLLLSCDRKVDMGRPGAPSTPPNCVTAALRRAPRTRGIGGSRARSSCPGPCGRFSPTRSSGAAAHRRRENDSVSPSRLRHSKRSPSPGASRSIEARSRKQSRHLQTARD
jgi:hypothetical protein